jgi:hypothetical protein
MKLKHFVGLDVHCQFTQAAVVDEMRGFLSRLQLALENEMNLKEDQAMILDLGPDADDACRAPTGEW